MLTLNSPQVVQETALRWKRDNKIVLVPTMGCLHSGHLALVDMARKHATKVVVSIFVNPLQFGPSEDFERYPRPFEEDQEKLDRAGVDLLFNPTVEDLYPDGFSTRVHVGNIADPMEGKSRPGHFEGVATVCLKLFQSTQADFAVFGEKDFQQLRVMERMTEDLNLPLTILSHEIVREEDGLAISSRNRYLSPEDRKKATKISSSLKAAREFYRTHSAVTVGELTARVRAELTSIGFAVDYVELAPARSLVPAATTEKAVAVSAARFFVAARLGQTRLIDNMPLNGERA